MTIDLQELEATGSIRTQRHPYLPLTVCKYTRQFQMRGEWDDVMLTMRGSVYDDDGHRVSQPLNKFFNYGEVAVPDGPYAVERKLDGTCIVVFAWEGQPVVHTLGAFTSPQAEAARRFIDETYGWEWLWTGQTFVFEWLDPDNFTTLRHRGPKQLVLLATLENGTEVPPSYTDWPGPVVELIEVLPDDIEALQAGIPDDEEGYVLVFGDRELGQHRRLKVKGARYLELARAKWNLTERTVWEYTFRRDIADKVAFAMQLDEEAQLWVSNVATSMRESVQLMHWGAERDLLQITGATHDHRERIEAAKQLEQPNRHYVLMRLNGKTPGEEPFIKAIKPRATASFAPAMAEVEAA